MNWRNIKWKGKRLEADIGNKEWKEGEREEKGGEGRRGTRGKKHTHGGGEWTTREKTVIQIRHSEIR